MAPYSMDLRPRVLRDADAGLCLIVLITARPDATLAELREQLPTRAAWSTLWRTIDRLNLTVRKTVHADDSGAPPSLLTDIAGATPVAARHAGVRVSR